MTERTVRHLAKEFCGAYYDSHERTARFRRENPNQLIYTNRMWPHFVDIARRKMVQMLTDNSVKPHIKDAIAAALIEENEKSQRPDAQYVPQATLDPVEKEDRKLIDANPQFVTSHNT